jgi:hypothetical protein
MAKWLGPPSPPAGRKQKRLQRYSERGERERYFHDDDDSDLATLVKRQRHEGAHDMDAALAANIGRKARWKGNELDADAEYDHDAGLELYEARSSKGTKVGWDTPGGLLPFILAATGSQGFLHLEPNNVNACIQMKELGLGFVPGTQECPSAPRLF